MCLCIYKNSAVQGVRGVLVGDQLTGVDACQVHSLLQWSQCVGELMRTDQRGYCLPWSLLRQNDISLNQQCMSSLSLSTYICVCVRAIFSLRRLSTDFRLLKFEEISTNIHSFWHVPLRLSPTHVYHESCGKVIFAVLEL